MLFSSMVKVRVMVSSSVWLVSGYAYAFVGLLLSAGVTAHLALALIREKPILISQHSAKKIETVAVRCFYHLLIQPKKNRLEGMTIFNKLTSVDIKH